MKRRVSFISHQARRERTMSKQVKKETIMKALTRKSILLAGLFLLLPAGAMAQDVPKAEVFGGYSYFNADRGGNLNGWNQ